MQEIRFFKYQGAGNDFVVLDNRKGAFSSLTEKQIARLCHRRFGIGADGLMRLEEASTGASARFKMDFYNSDGRAGSMCGNGGRCICAFALSLGLVKRGETFSFEAPDGLHEACIWEGEDGAETVALKMRDVECWKFDEKRHIYLIDTGSPHYICFVGNCAQADVVNEGKRIRYSEEFPAGINVDFVEILKEGDLWVRTYERGVEDETFACGTGVTASALAFALEKDWGDTGGIPHHDIKIHTRGGDLRVAFDRMAVAVEETCTFHNITLTGPACKVFEGVYRG